MRPRTRLDDDRSAAKALARLIAAAVPDGRLDNPALYKTVAASLRCGTSSDVVRAAIVFWRRDLDSRPFITARHFAAIVDRAHEAEESHA